MVIRITKNRFISFKKIWRLNKKKILISYTNKVKNVNEYTTYSKFAAIGALYDKGIGDS